MGTGIEDLLRLAWQADGAGKPGLRDALLTLAVVDSGVENAVLAERCRRLLVARRPDHWFATSATLGEALSHSKVAAALQRLRVTFPPVRVQRLLLRYAVLRGPFTGRSPSLAVVLDELTLPTSRPRQTVAAGSGPIQSLAFPGKSDDRERDGELVVFYVSILLAMAVLLHGVIQPAARDSRAA